MTSAVVWSVVSLALASLGDADAGTTSAPDAGVEVLSVFDAQARFLAGLPGTSDGPFAALETSASWKTHAGDLNKSWAQLEKRRLVPMRAWAESELAPQLTPSRPLVYLFGGPDAISVDVLYPQAPTLILCGLERPGEMPALETFTPKELEQSLLSLRQTIRTTVDMSYFITSQMGGDMLRSKFKGVLPVLMLFLARNGQHLVDVHAVTLNADGSPAELPKPPADGVSGWRVRFRANATAPVRELYYLRLDLSNDVVAKTPGMMKFLEAQGEVNAFLKAASFILHDRHFSTVRTYLLDHSASLLQDDSGVPFKFLSGSGWKLSLYGTYSAPKGVFEDHFQPDMKKAWVGAKALRFETGYSHESGSHLLLAVKAEAAKREGAK